MNRTHRRTEVVFFPDYSASNPYQRLFYDSIAKTYSATGGTIQTALWLQRQAELDTPTIFHLHWEDAIYRHVAGSSRRKATALESFFKSARSFKERGGVFIWTIHNETPHDIADTVAHRKVCSLLSDLADGIHFHSKVAADQATSRLDLNEDKLYVIPHGNYVPALGKRVTKQFAREKIGILNDKRVFVFFGRLLAYKGGKDLFSAFGKIDNADTMLLVCGKQIDHLPIETLAQGARKRVRVRNEYLPQEELDLHITASDFAVLPYRQSLTSGSIILAFSVGRPVVTPRLPAFRDLVTEHNSIPYDPDDEDGLRKALVRAASIDEAAIEEYGRQAQMKADSLDWSTIQEQILDMYERASDPSCMLKE